MIRFVCLLKRKTGLSRDEFNQVWREIHGPLVAYHQSRLRLLRCVQTHRDPDAEEGDSRNRAMRGMRETPFDGVTELWWQSEEELKNVVATQAGRDALDEVLANESNFVDTANSPFWFAHEYPQVNTRGQRVVAHPKTGIVKVHFALRALAVQSMADAQQYWRTMHGPLVRSYAAVRGVLCYQQVHRFESELDRQFGELRGAQVGPYFGHAEAWYDRLNSRAGPEFEKSTAAALADESKFIDWSRSNLFSGKEYLFVDRDWT